MLWRVECSGSIGDNLCWMPSVSVAGVALSLNGDYATVILEDALMVWFGAVASRRLRQ